MPKNDIAFLSWKSPDPDLGGSRKKNPNKTKTKHLGHRYTLMYSEAGLVPSQCFLNFLPRKVIGIDKKISAILKASSFFNSPDPSSVLINLLPLLYSCPFLLSLILSYAP